MDKSCRLMGSITRCCKLPDFLVVFPMRSGTRALHLSSQMDSSQNWNRAVKELKPSPHETRQKTLPKMGAQETRQSSQHHLFQPVVSFILFLVLRFLPWKIHPVSTLRLAAVVCHRLILCFTPTVARSDPRCLVLQQRPVHFGLKLECGSNPDAMWQHLACTPMESVLGMVVFQLEVEQRSRWRRCCSPSCVATRSKALLASYATTTDTSSCRRRGTCDKPVDDAWKPKSVADLILRMHVSSNSKPFPSCFLYANSPRVAKLGGESSLILKEYLDAFLCALLKHKIGP